MEINRRFQALHGGSDRGLWLEIQKVERDICLLYHQLANYSSVMGDLYYGDVYARPYWDYLDVGELPDDERRFLRDGGLVMIYAMAMDVIDGSGSYLTIDRSRFAAVNSAVARLECRDDDGAQLLGHVRAALRAAENLTSQAESEANAASVWIHETFVRAYFDSRTRSFRENPYYRRAGEAPTS